MKPVIITEQSLHDYNKWVMEFWSLKEVYIPFSAPKAYLKHLEEKQIKKNKKKRNLINY